MTYDLLQTRHTQFHHRIQGRKAETVPGHGTYRRKNRSHGSAYAPYGSGSE
jgi:hypothetical protein